MKKDEKKAFDMFVTIEKEMNGYYWAQRMLGVCYLYGRGVDAEDKKLFGCYSFSVEQGNSRAMNSVEEVTEKTRKKY